MLHVLQAVTAPRAFIMGRPCTRSPSDVEMNHLCLKLIADIFQSRIKTFSFLTYFFSQKNLIFLKKPIKKKIYIKKHNFRRRFYIAQ